MDVEKRIDEIDRELEDVKEDIEELQEEDDTEKEEEDETRTLYLYIQYDYETAEGLFSVHKSKVVVLEDEYAYTIPQDDLDEGRDNLQQALNLARKMGVDSWEKVELVAESEEKLYYRVEVSEETLKHLDGYIIDSSKAVDLISDYDERRYL